MLTPASCQLPAWLRLSSAGLWSLARPRCFQHDRKSVLSRIREAGILDGHVGWGRGVLSILLLLPLRVVWVTTSALLGHLSPAEWSVSVGAARSFGGRGSKGPETGPLLRVPRERWHLCGCDGQGLGAEVEVELSHGVLWAASHADRPAPREPPPWPVFEPPGRFPPSGLSSRNGTYSLTLGQRCPRQTRSEPEHMPLTFQTPPTQMT